MTIGTQALAFKLYELLRLGGFIAILCRNTSLNNSIFHKKRKSSFQKKKTFLNLIPGEIRSKGYKKYFHVQLSGL